MRRARRLTALAVALAVLGLTACGGGDGEEPSASPAPSGAQAPGGSTTPSAPHDGSTSSAPKLPPEAVECMAEQGYEVGSFADLNSLPQQAVQPCSGSLGQGH